MQRNENLPARLLAGWRGPTFWAALLLLVLPFVLFWPVWWPGAQTPMTLAYGDFTEQYYPMRAFVAGEWRSGRLPLWDPYTFGGTPAAAASLYAAYYPFNLWLALFPAPAPLDALVLEAIFHLSLAGVFTFLLVRRLTGRGSAGLLAGVAFSLGGFLTSYPVVQLGILETAAWLPLALWLLEGGLARRDGRRVAGAGLALACALLAGHPQTFLYMLYLTAAYFLLRAWYWRLPWRFVLITGFWLGLITVGGSAAQWLPSLELAPLSPRAALSYEAVSNGFSVAELWGMLRPNAGQWSPLYVGVLPVLLALAGPLLLLLNWRGRGRELATAGFWLAVMMTALLLALGRNGFLYPLAHGVLPGFSAFRNQERAAFLVSFALAVLAGYGWAALLRGWRVPVYWQRGAALGVALLTALDLYHANFGLLLAPKPSNGYFPATALVQHLQNTGSADWRTSTEGLLPGDGNAGSVFGIRDVSGNSPLHLAAYDAFLAQVPEERFWYLLNVQHLLTRRTLTHGALASVLTDGDLHLYQVFVHARPAWVVHNVQVVADQPAALAAAAAPAFDPRTTAVLEQISSPAPQPARGEDTVELVEFAPQRVTLAVNLSAPGVLVSSEIAYPGWTVRVNGAAAPALRANGVLRAVALPAGAATVEWRFRSVVAYGGLALSMLTWLMTGWLLLRRSRKAERALG